MQRNNLAAAEEGAEFSSAPADAAQIPAVFSKLASRDPYELGESYALGEWNVNRLDEFMCRVFSENKARRNLAGYWRLARYLIRNWLINPQSERRAFQVANDHYDLGNDLFVAMLDHNLSYTSGYWRTARSLDEAQTAKLDLICRKLALQPGMRVLDIGCGWGNFAKFAAEQYGVSVVGVTISREQAELARKRCAKLPVEIVLTDYRSLSGTYDCVVSIEMIEAVGRQNLRTFFEVAGRCLKNEGLFLVEAISRDTVPSHSTWSIDQFSMWLLKYIFPNGYLPRLDELSLPCRDLLVMEDVHNFGNDYDRTLICWAENFDRAWDLLRFNYSETFRRRWRYYLLSCAALFRLRRLQLYQLVYSKGGVKGGYQALR